MNDEFNQKDEMLRLTLMDGQARVLLCTCAQMAQTAADIHAATPVAAAAMGRLMAGTAMLGVMMKEENASVTVTADGGGPGGKMVCVAHGGRVKIAMDYPQAQVENLQSGKLNVGGLVGKTGFLTVVKDLGFGTPYVGRTPLVSGEIAEDFAAYFAQSEQQPSLVSLGVLTGAGRVLSAGGILVQPLPGCTEEVLRALEVRAMLFSAISRELAQAPVRALASAWFEGLSPREEGAVPLACRCDCSRERMEKALVALGREELSALIDEDQGAELTCHFCRAKRHFSTAQLAALLNSATAQGSVQ